jgi:hypothetical protein
MLGCYSITPQSHWWPSEMQAVIRVTMPQPRDTEYDTEYDTRPGKSASLGLSLGLRQGGC